jgi:hypothetical protein
LTGCWIGKTFQLEMLTRHQQQGVDMTDYLADVKKYDAGADEAVVTKIVKHLGIALRNRDSSLVSATDPKELARVVESWCGKKLGVTGAAAEAAVAATATAMKADHSKSRVTFYYLVAKELGKLGDL